MQNQHKNNHVFALFVIGVLFFIFGFMTWANSQLIPYLKLACELTTTQSYYVASAFFAAYFVMAIPSSYVLKITGFKKGMSIGLFVMALGAIIFIPAANARSFSIFLTGLFIIGSGLTLLQTASNPYVAALGPEESAAKRISIMGVCNKLAGILAVYVLGSIILSNGDQLEQQLKHMDTIARTQHLDLLAQKVITPYLWITVCFVVVGTALLFVNLPEIPEEKNSKNLGEGLPEVKSTKTSVAQFPHLILGVIALFFYIGMEIISYDTFTGFGQSLGYSLDVAKSMPTYTGYALLLGYAVGIWAIPKKITQRKALLIASILSIVFVLLSTFITAKPGLKTFEFLSIKATLPTHPAVWFFALLGFSNSVMWPAIFPMSIEGLGKFTKTGSALLVMAIVGGAILPPLYGALAERIKSEQMAYAMMVPCYLVILYFAWKGYAVGKNK